VLPSLLYPDSDTTVFGGGSGDEAQYRVELDGEGEWFLWGRFYYPGEPGSNDPNSFYVRVDDGARHTFGNSLNQFRRWHWDGDGLVEDDAARPVALGVLGPGEHLVVVEKREAGATRPRIDVIYLTDDPADVPNDSRARQALAGCLLGICPGGDGLCGDATDDGALSVADVLMILDASVNGSDSCQKAVCDVDSDGVVGATDALTVLMWVVGIEVEAACASDTAEQ
jgi:hypothetical protein